MRILFLSRIDPLPPEGGEQIRAWHFVKGLAERHDVDVVSFQDPDATASRVATAEPMISTWQRIELPTTRDLIARLWSYPRLRPKFVLHHRSQEFRAAVDRSLNRDPDIVHAFGLPLSQYLRVGRDDQPRVLDAMDSWSLRYRRYADAGSGAATLPWRLRALINGTEEKRAIQLGVPIVVTGQADRQRYLHLGADPGSVIVVPNGVDTAGYAPTSRPDGPSKRVVFVGDMAYRPNIEGIDWFLREVAPTIRGTHPEVQIAIVGKNPPERLQQMPDSNVLTTGYVEDVRPHLQRADVAIAPLFSGSGIKNKVLEAMAMAKPVVMTTIAQEGIPIEQGVSGVVRDDAAGFAAAINDLLSDGYRRAVIGDHARKLVERDFDWAVMVRRLEDVFEAAIGEIR